MKFSDSMGISFVFKQFKEMLIIRIGNHREFRTTILFYNLCFHWYTSPRGAIRTTAIKSAFS